MLLLVRGADSASCLASRITFEQVTRQTSSRRAASSCSKLHPKDKPYASQPWKTVGASTSKVPLSAPRRAARESRRLNLFQDKTELYSVRPKVYGASTGNSTSNVNALKQTERQPSHGRSGKSRQRDRAPLSGGEENRTMSPTYQVLSNDMEAAQLAMNEVAKDVTRGRVVRPPGKSKSKQPRSSFSSPTTAPSPTIGVEADKGSTISSKVEEKREGKGKRTRSKKEEKEEIVWLRRAAKEEMTGSKGKASEQLGAKHESDDGEKGVPELAPQEEPREEPREESKEELDHTPAFMLGRAPLDGISEQRAALWGRKTSFARLTEAALGSQVGNEVQDQVKQAEVEEMGVRLQEVPATASIPPALANRGKVYRRPEHTFGGVHATSHKYMPNYLDEAVLKTQQRSLTNKFADVNDLLPPRWYIALVLDGDQLLFLPELMNQGKRGAISAVNMIERYISDELGIKIAMNRLRIQIFCNLDLFSGYLSGAGLVDSIRTLREFRDELVLLGEFITFSTAGDEKDAADVKVRAHLEDHINNPNCQRVYLGGIGDHGYYDDLDYLRINKKLDKVRLLKFSDNKRDAEYYRNYLHLEADWSSNVFVTTAKLRIDHLLKTDKRGRDRYEVQKTKAHTQSPRRSTSRVGRTARRAASRGS